ncbi:leucyl aminopeptidase [Rhizobium sp. KVB221]|uniref:Probable cytosol aminopeptidase n=1 Tax=Rhizobium setariae TaxID=2801340 RepID=A0A937CL54_9HYPH|nr:leucyl aminopeptidase [Rhizobium setariae]MBL0371241.1 leucyl aminopeptidase [Rhizobium setariae]
MKSRFEFSFVRSAKQTAGTAVVLAAADKDQITIANADLVDPAGAFSKAARIAKFKAAKHSRLDLITPAGITMDRLIGIGLGKAADMIGHDWLKAGGVAAASLDGSDKVWIYLDVPGFTVTAKEVADFALGMTLRAYRFDKYKSVKTDEENPGPKSPIKVTVVTSVATAAKRQFEVVSAVADGVTLARDLVNEPPNVLGPSEFAARAKELEALGVAVEILTEKEMRKLGMGALLGVSQGSVRPPRLVVMQWMGAKPKDKSYAFVGKGVVFDTGGISIKPAAGMEEMKGDMGGAAAVTGLMHVLAARKAKVNAIGIIGLVENMPDGNAQRPGDIVTSMSGQTIEIINTDAEGRLVLCDALWYCNERFKPAFMINLATLTGAIGVALGSYHAGLFANDDMLATNLLIAGINANERLWRMPLGREYDKMIDSRFADMRNTGGSRQGGAITAAQFLKRFVGNTPWAHLDIASTAMGSPSDEINQSWGSGFGVRLLDELVRSNYEN